MFLFLFLGQYRVALPDCTTQIVDYFVDEYQQYHADVKYEGVPCPEPEKPKYAPAPVPAYAPAPVPAYAPAPAPAYAPAPVYAPAPAYAPAPVYAPAPAYAPLRA